MSANGNVMYRMLHFVKNERARDDQSPLKSCVKIQGRDVIVFPQRNFIAVFQEPGLYWAKIELRDGATFLFAEPAAIVTEDALEVIRAVSEFALSDTDD